jgi:hypothetical protein
MTSGHFPECLLTLLISRKFVIFHCLLFWSWRQSFINYSQFCLPKWLCLWSLYALQAHCVPTKIMLTPFAIVCTPSPPSPVKMGGSLNLWITLG